MTDEERTIITAFIQRVGGAAVPSQGSVPATIPAQALPPVDPDADRLIADLFQRYPEARYRLTQTAFVQEHALAQAQARIAQLQAALQQQGQAQGQQGGFFQNLFGAQPRPQPYQPYPQTPPPYAAPAQQAYVPGGTFQRGGSGFLGSALTTAAGVAGGLVAGNALMDLFGGHHGYEGGFAPDQGMGGGPWGDGGQSTASGWDNATENSQPAGWDNCGSAGGTGGGTGGGGGTF
jgi:hypothetical protein